MPHIGQMISMAYFVTEMYSTRAWKVDNISVWTIHRCNRRFIGFPKIYSSSVSMLGFKSNWQKCNSWHTKWTFRCTVQQQPRVKCGPSDVWTDNG